MHAKILRSDWGKSHQFTLNWFRKKSKDTGIVHVTCWKFVIVSKYKKNHNFRKGTQLSLKVL